LRFPILIQFEDVAFITQLYEQPLVMSKNIEYNGAVLL